MLQISITAAFKKDLKKAKKQKRDIDLLNKVVDTLASGEVLDDKYRDHSLSGNYEGFRECHVSNDWLLIYKIKGDVLVLVLSRIGSHSELF